MEDMQGRDAGRGRPNGSAMSENLWRKIVQMTKLGMESGAPL